MIDEKLKLSIINSTNNVRKKYKLLKEGVSDAKVFLEDSYKPIIEPLKMLVDNQNNSNNNFIKSEIKKEIKLENKNKFKTEKKDDIFNEPKIDDESNDNNINNDYDNDNDENDDDDETSGLSSTYNKDSTFSPNSYISKVVNSESGMDGTYGVRFYDGELLLGNSIVEFDEENNVVVNGINYTNSHGLYELIFKKIPNRQLYNTRDLENYKKIGLETNLFRRKYNENNSINGTQSKKYTGIIAKLIKSEKKSKTKTGASLKCCKKNKKIIKGYGHLTKNKDLLMSLQADEPVLTYWNNPNELVERLRLIMGSELAGNNMHRNEVISIIAELKEEGIIQK